MLQSERLRLLFWLLTALIAVAGLFWIGEQRVTLSSPLSPEDEIESAFWRLEVGDSLSPAEQRHLSALLSQIPDTAYRPYSFAVGWLLIYGTEHLSGPPMLYVQRLQQLREVPIVRAFLGRLAAHTGQTEKARLYLREAIQMDSTCGTPYLFLAQLEGDSACEWLARSERAILTPIEKAYREKLRARLRCP
ncbi:MAG: hypothetical protein RMK19_01875 [Bacteroidia bacterium]|nr:hypothetical protein [Bacteroidia bacterium]MDW8014742.1 hypothetical protein [Bacteroidia bacterium]